MLRFGPLLGKRALPRSLRIESLEARQLLSISPAVSLGESQHVAEGTAFHATGSFVDNDSTSWRATVDYGDGTGRQALALKSDKTFDLERVYQSPATMRC